MSDLFGTSVLGIRQFTSGTQEDSLGELVFNDNTQSKESPIDIDWDELDLQLFDGTSSEESEESDSSSDVSDDSDESEAATEGEWIKTVSDGEIVINYNSTDSDGTPINAATFVEETSEGSDGSTSSVLTITSINSEALNEDGQLVLNFGGFDDMVVDSEAESESDSEAASGGAMADYAQLNLTDADAPIVLKNNHNFTDVRGAENHSNDLYAGRFGSSLKGGSQQDLLHGKANQKDVFIATAGGDRIKNYGRGDRIRLGDFFASVVAAAKYIILKKIGELVGANDVDDDSAVLATNALVATQGVVIDADGDSESTAEGNDTVTLYYDVDSDGATILYATSDGSGDYLAIEGVDPENVVGNRALRFTNDTTGEDITLVRDADSEESDESGASDESEAASDESEATSDESEATSDESEATSDESEATSDESEATSDESEATSDESEATSDESEATSDESEATSDESEATSDESEATSDESEAASDESEESTIPNIIDKSTTISDIEKIFGVATQTAKLGGFSSADEKMPQDTLTAILGGSTAGGVSRADLNQPLELWLTNDGVETQDVNLSTINGVKQVHLYEGAQDVAFNSAVSGNVAHVTDDATGAKDITLGGGDAVIVDMPAEAKGANVNILGGAGNDSVVVRDSAPVTFDMSQGGKDILFTFAAVNARVSLEGYNATTGAAIQVEEQGASVMAEAVRDSLIGFGDGTVIIQSGDDKSKVYLGESETNGWLVNMKTPHKDSDTVQAVGFTGHNGGTVDGSAYDKPLVMVGNMDGTKRDGSSLVGGSGNDTFFGGAGDTIITGDGKDSVVLGGDSTRDGAVVNISKGRVTIDGTNNVLGGFTGDTIAIDDLDITTTKFTYAGDSLLIKDETLGFHAVLSAVSSLEGGYVTQYIQNTTTDITYSVAIGAESSTMYVADDEEARANAYIGKNSAVNFTNYNKDAFIDLGKDWAESYIDGERIYLEGVNQLVGGEGDMVFKGSEGKDTLIAGKGNTSLYGAGGLNVLNGYTGSDKEGSTTFFVIGGNDGAVSTINNFQFVGSNNYYDAANVTADQLETQIQYNHFSNVAAVDNDLLLEVTSNTTGESEKALLVGAFENDTYSQDFVVNGIVAQVGKDGVNFDGTADYYFATGTNVTVNVDSSVTDEAIVWLDDPDRGTQFEGDFQVIDARNSSARAQLAGNTSDNVIYAGTGATSLWGGNGGNDLLVGNTGADNFYYAAGNGNDTIDSAGGNDNVNLLNLTLADLSIETITSSAVVLNFTDGGKLTVNDNNSGVNFKVGDATYVINSSRTDFEQK